MLKTFKPENIFYVQGHGGSKEIYNARSRRQTSALNPFGERTEFERIDVSKNVFTASIFEVGLAVPPVVDPIIGLKNLNKGLKVPEFTQSYYTYTKTLRDLGYDLWKIIFPPSSTFEQTIFFDFNDAYMQQYGIPIPKTFRMHGHKHPDYSSLPQQEQKRDYFLFSSPNDEIWLSTFQSIQSDDTPSTKTDIGGITFIKDCMLSGIIPLNELQASKGLFTVGIIIPTTFYSTPLKNWKNLIPSLSPAIIQNWKTQIQNSMQDYEYFKVDGNSDLEKKTKIENILNSIDFANQFIDLIIGNLKQLYFWSIDFPTEADFLNKMLDTTNSNAIQRKSTSDEVIRKIQQKRGTKEPILIIFYHCRSALVDPSRGIYGYYNNASQGFAKQWKRVTKKPLLARSYSRSALEGNAKTQGLTNLELAGLNRIKRQRNFGTLKSMGYANKNISNAYYKARANINVAKGLLQQQKLNREQQIAATTQGIQQSYSPIQQQLEEAEALRLSRKPLMGGVKLKRKTRHRRRSNRKTRRHG